MLASLLLLSCTDPHGGEADRCRALFDPGRDFDELRAAFAAVPFDRIEVESFNPWTMGGPRITLQRNGQAQRVDRDGLWNGSIDARTFGRLCCLLERQGVSALSERYEVDGFDLSTTTLRVWPRDEDEPWQVNDYGEAGPLELWTILLAVQGISDWIQWEPAEALER